MRVTGEGVRDQFSDQRDRLGGGFLARDLALVAATLLASARLMSLVAHVFRLFSLFSLFSEK